MKYQASEYDECVLLADYLNMLMDQKKIRMFTHIPNETYTKSWSAKRKNKAMGVASGVPDYMILLNDKVLFLEMKRTKGGKPSKEQEAWIDALTDLKFDAYIAYGFEDARAIIDSLC